MYTYLQLPHQPVDLFVLLERIRWDVARPGQLAALGIGAGVIGVCDCGLCDVALCVYSWESVRV